MLSLHARIIAATTTHDVGAGGRRGTLHSWQDGWMIAGGLNNRSYKSKQPQPPGKCTHATQGTVKMLQAETVLGCVALSALIDITYLAPPHPHVEIQ